MPCTLPRYHLGYHNWECDECRNPRWPRRNCQCTDDYTCEVQKIFMLNNKQSAAQIVCNATCLGNLGAGSGSFTVTDVITGAPHSTAQLEAGGSVAATVPGYGASAYLRLDPK